MARRRMVRDFPVFFAYTVFEACKETLLFSLDHMPSVSMESYWTWYGTSLDVDVVLRFAVIYETFGKVLHGYPGLKKLGKLVLGWSGVLLVIIATAIAWFSPGIGEGRFTYGYQLVERTVSLVQSGLLIGIFLFASYFGLSWRNFTFGIALGMGIYSSMDLLNTAMRLQAGPFPTDFLLDFLMMVTYHVSVLIWLGYLLLPETATRPVGHLPGDNLEQWNTELERLLLQ
jgi:hypothetical protein